MLATRRSRTILWLLLIASLGFNLGVGATHGVQAYRRYCGPGEGPGGPRRHDPLARLDLTPQQAEQVAESKKQMRKDIRPLRSQLREANNELTVLLAVDEPDRAAITAHLEQVAAIRTRMHLEFIEHFLDIKDLLDAEQRAVFDTEILPRLFAFDRHGPGFGKKHKGRGNRSHRNGRGPRDDWKDHGDRRDGAEP